MSLAPGSTQTVSFILARDEAGIYDVEIGGLRDVLKVIAPASFEVA
jgi:hypothetical protein